MSKGSYFTRYMQLKNGTGTLQTTTPLPFSCNGCNWITSSATPQNNTVYTNSVMTVSVLIWNAMFWPTRVIIRHKYAKLQWLTFTISHLLKSLPYSLHVWQLYYCTKNPPNSALVMYNEKFMHICLWCMQLSKFKYLMYI